jgi:hypothetical protein
VKLLSQVKMKKLNRISEFWKCELYLPPFMNRYNPFLDVTSISYNPLKISGLQDSVEEINCNHELHFVGKKRLLEIIAK